MVILEIGKIYTQKELAIALGVSPTTFSRNRDKYIKNLMQYYEFEIKYGRPYRYKIIAKIADYQTPKRKNDIEKSKKFARDEIMKVAKETDLFTWKGIQRKVISEGRQGKMSNSYLYERIRIEGNESFGKRTGDEGTKGSTLERVWCRLVDGINLYEPIDDELIKIYRQMVNENNKLYEIEKENLYEDYENGGLTKDEYDSLAGDALTSVFINAKNEFKEKYGFRPIKIPRRELKAWEKNEE